MGCKPKIYYLSPRYVTTLDFYNHKDKYSRLLVPEELMLVKEKAVAIQYPEDCDPCICSDATPVDPRWSEILKSHPELKDIINYSKHLNK